MQKKILFLPIIFYFSFLLLTTTVLAKPVFIVEPVVKAPAEIFVGNTVKVQYRVTNNLSCTFVDNGVVDLPAGITQDSSSGCANPFNLAGHASCILNLTIDPQVAGKLAARPTVCHTASSRTYCSIPSNPSDYIDINVVNPPASYTTISAPAEIKLDPDQLGQNFTITNTGDDTWQNPNVTLSPNLFNVSISGCDSPVAPSGSCQITFDTTGANLSDTASLNISGDNIVTASSTVTVDSGVKIEKDDETGNQHLAYRAVSVKNSSNESLIVTDIKIAGDAAGKIQNCNDVSTCLAKFKSTCEIDKTTLLPGQKCLIWLNALKKEDEPIGNKTGKVVIKYKNPNAEETKELNISYHKNLYAGGNFNTAGDKFASKIARYDGSKWFALTNEAIDAGSVRALESDKYGDLIMGGEFTKIGARFYSPIARWDGISWNRLGIGLGDATGHDVYSLTKDRDGNLIAGGDFTIAEGNTNIRRVALWDGEKWQQMGNILDGTVYALIKDSNGDIIAGGSFDGLKKVAKWDGSNWNTVGSGLVDGPQSDNVYALLETNSGELIAGGEFALPVDTKTPVRLAKYTGEAWSGVAVADINNDVYALSKDGDGNIIIGGAFTNFSGSNDIDRIVKWDGNTSFTKLGGGNGMNSNVRALLKCGSDTIAGGDFTQAGYFSAAKVAKYDDYENKWAGTDSGITASVYAVIILPSITFH